MMVAVVAATASVAALKASGGAAVAAAQPAPPLTLRNAWSRATAPGASVGVLYFDIVNAGAADELLAIESPAAQRVEMHLTTMVGGMMEMRPAETVAIPAMGHVAFAPGGLHAMMIDLKQPLVEGAELPLTLVFRHAGRVAAQAVVLAPGATRGPAGPGAATAPTGAKDPAGATAPPRDAYRLSVWPPHAGTPDFALTDSEGRARTLADYRGHVVVLFFGFVHCPDFCPAVLFKLATLMKRLGPMAEHIQVLFVTLDPERDSGGVLRGYVAAFDPRFVGLTGSPSQIGRAADNFHVEYARVPTGAGYTIDHSTSTFVLDAGGRLRLVGTASASVADYAHDLALLVAE
jgi:protein SCO1/2